MPPLGTASNVTGMPEQIASLLELIVRDNAQFWEYAWKLRNINKDTSSLNFIMQRNKMLGKLKLYRSLIIYVQTVFSKKVNFIILSKFYVLFWLRIQKIEIKIIP